MNQAAKSFANWYSSDIVPPGIHATWYKDGMITYFVGPNLSPSILIPLLRQYTHNFDSFAIEKSNDGRVVAVVLDRVEFPEVIMGLWSKLGARYRYSVTYVDNRQKDDNTIGAFAALVEGLPR